MEDESKGALGPRGIKPALRPRELGTSLLSFDLSFGAAGRFTQDDISAATIVPPLN